MKNNTALKVYKIFPSYKKANPLYLMEEKIPKPILNKSEALSKTIENFENFKTITNRTNYKKNNNIINQKFTLKDSDFISTLYTTFNKDSENEIGSKYYLNTDLNSFQKTTIQKFVNKKKRDNSILIHSIDTKSSYLNPYDSQHTLNFNQKVFTTLNNIRMESQFNLYTKKINEYHQNQKMINLMPKITISKITFDSNHKIKKGKNRTRHIKTNSQSQSISKFNQESDLPDLNSNKVFHREYLINNVKLIQGTLETLIHPSSRGQFSLCKTQENLIYIFGGLQSKFLNDLWVCSITTKNKIQNSKNEKKLLLEQENIKWRKIITNEEETPIQRYGHSMVYYMDNLYIFGGIIPKNTYHEQEENICIFDIKRESFYYPKCQNHKSVKSRRNHIGIGIGYTMLIHGGIDEEGNFLDDMWLFDCLRYKWFPLNYRNLIKIPKIAFHSSALVIKNKSFLYHRDLNIYKFPEGTITKGKIGKPKIEGIYFFGGIDKENNFYKKFWLIRIGVKPVDIVEIPTHGISPSPRINCGLCYFDILNLLCIYGGRNDENNMGNLLNDVWFFDLENFNWVKPLYDDSMFHSVAEHSIVSDGNKILVLGGFGVDGYVKFNVYTIEFDVNSVQEEDLLKDLMK